MAAQSNSSSVRIALVNGGYALVSLKDYGKVRGIPWWRRRNGAREYVVSDKEHGMVLMHTILVPGIGGEIDHISGDGLDNRRENLRRCTHAQNTRNRAKHKVKTSRFKGVHRERNKWRARIRRDGIYYTLGFFDTEREAALAYDAAAPRLHRAFARTNADLGLL
jgi:hypothetical protein